LLALTVSLTPLAALLATSPDDARRDPKRALEPLEQVMPYVDFDPTAFEVRAAAKAMLGDFVGAQADQKTALQERMASYAASTPWTGDLFAY
jgi:hypothetical protein